MITYEFFNYFAGLIRNEAYTTDNLLFKFYYRWSVAVHLVFFFLLSAKTYFGSPIICGVRDGEIGDDMINEFCWIQGTWTVKDKDPMDIPDNIHRRRVGHFFVKQKH